MSKYNKLALVILVLVVAAAWICYTAFSGTSDNIKIRKGLDIAGGMRVVLQADRNSADWPKTDVQAQRDLMDKATSTIEKRIGGLKGVSEGKAFIQGADKIVVEIPGIKDSDKALDTISNTAQLEFYYLKDVQSASNPGGRWKISDGGQDEYVFSDGETEIYSGDKEKVMKEVVGAPANKPILTGKDLMPNSRQAISNKTQPVVEVQFNKEGRVIFKEFTKKHVGDTLAIFLNKELLTAPTINEPILNGEAQISGFKDLEEAKNLANLLNSGALPISFEVGSQESVDPTIGGDAFSKTVKAGAIGLLVVILFMIFIYRLPGFIASLALCIYTMLVIAIFAALGVTMSLSGIGALIISIGMAVDANILIFERLKEELKAGRTLSSAIDTGFKRAFTAILDSNVSTCITCLLLIQFGSPAVQSFAVTLLVGTLVSMFSAITVTRTLLHLTVNFEGLQKPELFCVSDSKPTAPFNFVFVDNRTIYYAISGIVMACCIAALLVWKLNPGIEFKPGTELKVSFKQSIASVQDIKGIVDGLYEKNQIQLANGSKTAIIKVTGKDQPNISTKDQDALVAALNDKYEVARTTDDGKPIADQANSVNPSVSKELVHNALIAVFFACIAIILYLAIRFAIGGALDGVKYGVCAVIALIHDALFVMGLFAILGKFLGWQVNSLFVTAVLTVIGVSVNDTIVSFDRIRENLRHRLKGENFSQLVNRSLNQTLTRSIYTSVTTLLTIASLIIFGGLMLRQFYWTIFAGLAVGTYSSIFLASQLVVSWYNAGLSKKDRALNRVVVKDKEGKVLVSAPKPQETEAPEEEDGSSPAAAPEKAPAAKAKKKNTGRKRRF
ncbi:MAG: protein translocase subunit SecD [Abditibacteriota bacterium]|nr:protein translocase subunit SecD [Abditibacteriota bacterium]